MDTTPAPNDLPVFPPEEFASRIERVRAEMDRRGLAGLLVSSPENLYYLTGLDHMGYFAFQALLLPLEGEASVISRAMERATMRDQVPHLRHVGYADGGPKITARSEDDAVFTVVNEEGRQAGLRPWEMSLGVETREAGSADTSAEAGGPGDAVADAIRHAGLRGETIGLEKASTFLPLRVVESIFDALPHLEWEDASGLVDDIRLVQSPREQERTRAAARISDTMMLSAIATAGEGVPTHDVMAAIYDSMFRRGGTYPGFVPLVRSTRTLSHEHGTWQSGELRHGDLLFLEMAGCVRRYHAPLGRLLFLGDAPDGARRMLDVCRRAQDAAAEAIGPGARAREVYAAWQGVVDAAELDGYHRHHCGYSVGIGYPPSWSGSGVPVGLRASSDLELGSGMVFHLMSWLLRTGRGDAFLSDTILVTDDGCEFLTRVSRKLHWRS